MREASPLSSCFTRHLNLKQRFSSHLTNGITPRPSWHDKLISADIGLICPVFLLHEGVFFFLLVKKKNETVLSVLKSQSETAINHLKNEVYSPWSWTHVHLYPHKCTKWANRGNWFLHFFSTFSLTSLKKRHYLSGSGRPTFSAGVIVICQTQVWLITLIMTVFHLHVSAPEFCYCASWLTRGTLGTMPSLTLLASPVCFF